MIPHVNLLPEAYRRARARRLKVRRVGVLVAAALIVETGSGVILHWRAQEGRRLMSLAEQAREKSVQLQERLEAPRREAALIRDQLALSERLHERHLWSRLLATLSATFPEGVTLTALSTDPARWSPALLAPKEKPAASPAGKSTGNEAPPRLLEGVSIKGLAASHQELAALMSAMQGSGMFATLDLRDMRRDASGDDGAMMFELHCRW